MDAARLFGLILFYLRVVGEKREFFGFGLGDQHTVEGILMNEGKSLERRDMFHFYGEDINS